MRPSCKLYVFLPTLVFFSACAVAAETLPLRVTLETPNNRYVLGELICLQIAVENIGTRPVDTRNVVTDFVEPENKNFTSATGEVFNQYVAAVFNPASVTRTIVTLAPGKPRRYLLRVLYSENSPGKLAFSEPGNYWIKVRYPHVDPATNQRTEIESNAIRLEIRKPHGSEEQIWEVIKDPEYIRFLHAGFASERHQDVPAREARLLAAKGGTCYDSTLRNALGIYYHDRRFNDRNPDIEDGYLLRRVLNQKEELISDVRGAPDWDHRLFQQRVAYAAQSGSTISEALAAAEKQTAVALTLAPEVSSRSAFHTSPIDVTLYRFMQLLVDPGRTTWLRDGNGYRLAPIEDTPQPQRRGQAEDESPESGEGP